MVRAGSAQYEAWRREPLPIAAVEGGLAVAALPQFSAPEHLKLLGPEHGLGPLAPTEAAAYRRRASRTSKAAESLHRMLVQTLWHAAG